MWGATGGALQSPINVVRVETTGPNMKSMWGRAGWKKEGSLPDLGSLLLMSAPGSQLQNRVPDPELGRRGASWEP